MSTQGPMVRPRVPQGLPPGSSQGPKGPSVLQTSRLQGFKDPHPKVAPKCPDWPGAGAWGPCPRPGPGARLGTGPGPALGPGVRGPGASGPGLSVLWRCVVSPEPRGLGLGLGLGLGARARGSTREGAMGPGPRARDRGTKYAATVLSFKAALTIYLTGISSSWRLPHP